MISTVAFAPVVSLLWQRPIISQTIFLKQGQCKNPEGMPSGPCFERSLSRDLSPLLPMLPLIHPLDHLSHTGLRGDERTVTMRAVPGTVRLHLQLVRKDTNTNDKPEKRKQKRLTGN